MSIPVSSSKISRQQQILNGMKEISATVGRSEETVLSLKRHYLSMPIRKISHVWTSERSVLLGWWRRYALGEVPEPEAAIERREGKRSSGAGGK